uniref:Uncharacterized protein n=1 Tax=Anopheles merus TaxID=30066 RepID=A0A182UWH9_ANOME
MQTPDDRHRKCFSRLHWFGSIVGHPSSSLPSLQSGMPSHLYGSSTHWRRSAHLNWFARQVIGGQSFSSCLSKQSSSPSHTQLCGMQCPVRGQNGPSSDPSPQSFSLSHFQMFGMQRPFSHANCDAAHVTLPHSNSSEWSPQSFSWSHRKLSGMHRPDLHWNSFVPHVGSVKSHVFGHAWTGGSAFGSDRQLRPSSPSRSPYGQPHLTTSRGLVGPAALADAAAAAASSVSFLGSAKHSFSQPPLLTPHGWLASMLCTPWLYTFTPYSRFVCGSRTIISSCSPFSLFSRTIASSRQSVMYIHSSCITIENGCRIRREFTVRTSVPSRLACCTWSSSASHQYTRSSRKSIDSPFGQPSVRLRNTISPLPSAFARLMLAGRSHSEK